MNKIKESWERFCSWFLALKRLGEKIEEKDLSPIRVGEEIVQDPIKVIEAAKAYLRKKPKFKIGDIVEWIPECRLNQYPRQGQQGIVVGFDLPKFIGNPSPSESIEALDLKLLVQGKNGNTYVFASESWRFQKIGSIVIESEKKKKSEKKPARKKKAASKKKSKKRSKLPKESKATETSQPISQSVTDYEKPKRKGRKGKEQSEPSPEAT